MSHREWAKMGAKDVFVSRAATLVQLYSPADNMPKPRWGRTILMVLTIFIVVEATVGCLSAVNFPPMALSLNDPPQPLFPIFAVQALSYFFGGDVGAWVATGIGVLASWIFFVDPPWLSQPDLGGVLWAITYSAVLIIVNFCLTHRHRCL